MDPESAGSRQTTTHAQKSPILEYAFCLLHAQTSCRKILFFYSL